MHTNIRKLYLLHLLTGLVFWYPIEKLFLQHIGAGAFGISINAIVFLVTLILFDVPSGVLADRWKRKNTLVLALLCFIAACIWGGLSHTWKSYLPMNVLLGGFVVLTSGTFQAMMYDSLRDSGHQSTYDSHQGRAYALFLGGLGLSSLAGGYIAAWLGMPATYFLTGTVMLAALVCACTLQEPASHKRLNDQKLRQHIQISLRQLSGSQLLLQLALLITAAGVLRGTQNEYSGVLFIALGLGAIPMGYAGGAKWLASSMGQMVAPKLGRRALKFVPLFFASFLVFSLLHTIWTLVFFYIASLLYSVIANQAEAAIQDNTPTEVRATTLSVLSFATNILLVPLGLLFGWIAQTSNVFNAYLLIALLGLIYMIVWLMRGRHILRGLYGSKGKAQQFPSIETELTQ